MKDTARRLSPQKRLERLLSSVRPCVRKFQSGESERRDERTRLPSRESFGRSVWLGGWCGSVWLVVWVSVVGMSVSMSESNIYSRDQAPTTTGQRSTATDTQPASASVRCSVRARKARKNERTNGRMPCPQVSEQSELTHSSPSHRPLTSGHPRIHT